MFKDTKTALEFIGVSVLYLAASFAVGYKSSLWLGKAYAHITNKILA